MTLNDPEVVQRDYASEARLLDRRSLYAGSDGPDAREVVWRHVAAADPRKVLEVGPGPGELSERIARELGADVIAIDVSPRMVELTRARGIDALLGDVQELPFDDERFDLVVAAWVLFHPADLAAALSEIARVLRPADVSSPLRTASTISKSCGSWSAGASSLNSPPRTERTC